MLLILSSPGMTPGCGASSGVGDHGWYSLQFCLSSSYVGGGGPGYTGYSVLARGGKRISGLAMKRGSLSDTAVGEEGGLTGKKFSLSSTTPWTMAFSFAFPSILTIPFTPHTHPPTYF